MKSEGRVEVCWTRGVGRPGEQHIQGCWKDGGRKGVHRPDGQGWSSSVSWAPVRTLGFIHSLVGSYLLIFNRV